MWNWHASRNPRDHNSIAGKVAFSGSVIDISHPFKEDKLLLSESWANLQNNR